MKYFLSENLFFQKHPLTFALPKKGNDSVAQLVEQYTFNVWALGSSPSGITLVKIKRCKSIDYNALFFVLTVLLTLFADIILNSNKLFSV